MSCRLRRRPAIATRAQVLPCLRRRVVCGRNGPAGPRRPVAFASLAFLISGRRRQSTIGSSPPVPFAWAAPADGRAWQFTCSRESRTRAVRVSPDGGGGFRSCAWKSRQAACAIIAKINTDFRCGANGPRMDFSRVFGTGGWRVGEQARSGARSAFRPLPRTWKERFRVRSKTWHFGLQPAFGFRASDFMPSVPHTSRGNERTPCKPTTSPALRPTRPPRRPMRPGWSGRTA